MVDFKIYVYIFFPLGISINCCFKKDETNISVCVSHVFLLLAMELLLGYFCFSNK